ncbi:MAG: type II toxin-antitoxin system HicA family toxin [Parcubacteria group bacterium]|nr:type II toxin-antitoxin system HicA family toxin [Parcubacteria group bacterium]
MVRILNHLGFVKIRQSGSHAFYLHLDGRSTIVSSHGSEEIGRGLLRRILRKIEISPENFMEML